MHGNSSDGQGESYLFVLYFMSSDYCRSIGYTLLKLMGSIPGALMNNNSSGVPILISELNVS